jgi:uncharacterized membrane protein (DUF373 family)
MSDQQDALPGTQPPEAREDRVAAAASCHGRKYAAGRRCALLIDLVQYGVAIVLLVLAAVVLVRSFIGFFTSPSDYTTALISAVDGVLVVIILVDIMRTVLTHLEGWGFPYRPFLVIGIIAAVRDILAVSTRLTFSAGAASSGSPTITQSLFELGTNAGVILVLAVALFLTRGQDVDAETETRE